MTKPVTVKISQVLSQLSCSVCSHSAGHQATTLVGFPSTFFNANFQFAQTEWKTLEKPLNIAKKVYIAYIVI